MRPEKYAGIGILAPFVAAASLAAVLGIDYLTRGNEELPLDNKPQYQEIRVCEDADISTVYDNLKNFLIRE